MQPAPAYPPRGQEDSTRCIALRCHEAVLRGPVRVRTLSGRASASVARLTLHEAVRRIFGASPKLAGMTLRLDHVGLAVRHAPEVLDVLGRVIGLHTFAMEDIEEQGVRAYLFSAGTASLELLEGLTEDSPVTRFLKRRGEGVHHLAFEVPDIRYWMKRVRAAGFAPLTRKPVRGADGRLIFFLHPADTHGVLFEFCQAAEQERVIAVLTEENRWAAPALGSQFRVFGVSTQQEVEKALAKEEAHIVATGSAASWAMELARHRWPQVLSIALHNPGDFEAHDANLVFFICATNEPEEVDRILAAHRAIDTSELAVLPQEYSLDSRVVARLLEQFYLGPEYGGFRFWQ